MKVGDLVTWRHVARREVGVITYINGQMAQVHWTWGAGHYFFFNLEVIDESR